MAKVAYIGCRTTRERNARGKGLKVCRVLDDGSFSEIQLMENMENPSYQCLDREKKFLYSVHGDAQEVSSFRILADGTLEYLNTVGNVGRNPVFITVDRTNRFLYAASLQGGCVNIMRRKEDGSAEEPFCKASIPGKTENGISHAHQCLWDNTETYLFVPTQGRGIGYGEVNVFKKQEDGMLEQTDRFYARVLDEPRHGAIHPNNRFFYLINERGNSVTFFLFDQEKGKLEAKQNVQLLPETYVGEGQASAVLVHPSGKFLYGSNRIHNSITTFAIDENTGYLKYIGNTSCLGKTPRFMTFSSDHRELIVANEDSDDIRFFRINENTGELVYADKVFYTESPVCITFCELCGNNECEGGKRN